MDEPVPGEGWTPAELQELGREVDENDLKAWECGVMRGPRTWPEVSLLRLIHEVRRLQAEVAALREAGDAEAEKDHAWWAQAPRDAARERP